MSRISFSIAIALLTACTSNEPAAGHCGDGEIDDGELCDDGNRESCDGCSAACTIESCGNGLLDCAELCDDANTTPGDGCGPSCVLERCGNGALEAGEECDDGNLGSGDGCSTRCLDEGEGLLGTPCTDGGDCASGLCVPSDAGYVCTVLCEVDCPADWTCRGIRAEGGQPVLACLPDDARLCQVCTADRQCGNGLCLALADGNACSRPCRAETDCPTGFACELRASSEDPAQSSNQCVPRSDRCDCTAGNATATRACATANGFGTCTGSSVCQGDTGWSTCSAATPAADLCNGQDDDCDGWTDEEVSEPTSPCEVSNGIGTCTAEWSCRGADGWVCPAATPAAELCNGRDDDCDGDVDEDFLVAGVYLSDDNCGECGHTCTNAIPHGVATCAAPAGTPRCMLDTCLDDYLPMGNLCAPAGTGSCEPCLMDLDCALSVARCVELADGRFCLNPCSSGGTCPAGTTCVSRPEGDLCAPTTDACLCDGTNPSLVRSCSVTAGDTTCFGQMTCEVSGWSSCALPAEDCNLVDDDCNGEIDEGFLDPYGRYTGDTDCGACGNDCTQLTFGSVIGACNSLADPPICSVSCAGGCFDVNANPMDGCECCDPAPQDFPDPGGTDANCDGVDGDANDAIFVAPHGDDADPGTLYRPVRTIQAGIAAAVAGGRRDVYVASGLYEQRIDLAEGVGVYGGYSSDFRARDAAVFVTVIAPSTAAASPPGAVNAVGVGTVSTVFDGFVVRALPASAGAPPPTPSTCVTCRVTCASATTASSVRRAETVIAEPTGSTARTALPVRRARMPSTCGNAMGSSRTVACPSTMPAAAWAER